MLTKRNTTNLETGDSSDVGTIDDKGRNKSIVVNGNTQLEKDTTSPNRVHRATLIVGDNSDADE